MKRTADSLVAVGKDITDAMTFFKLLTREGTTVKLFYVKEEEINIQEQKLPADIPVLKGQ